MPDEVTAAATAATYANDNLPGLAGKIWKGTPFPGGWIMYPTGDDMKDRLGYSCLILLDDGRVVEESASVPPPWLAAMYMVDEGPSFSPTAAIEAGLRHAASHPDQAQGDELAGYRWSASRCPGAWLLEPEGRGGDQPRPFLVVLDNGQVHQETGLMSRQLIVAQHVARVRSEAGLG